MSFPKQCENSPILTNNYAFALPECRHVNGGVADVIIVGCCRRPYQKIEPSNASSSAR